MLLFFCQFNGDGSLVFERSGKLHWQDHILSIAGWATLLSSLGLCPVVGPHRDSLFISCIWHPRFPGASSDSVVLFGDVSGPRAPCTSRLLANSQWANSNEFDEHRQLLCATERTAPNIARHDTML
jgi:hypothetical protein